MLRNDISTIDFSPEKLELALEEKSMTQSELNEKVGFQHRNVVNKIIKGKRGATAAELLRIAAALGKSPEYFSKCTGKNCY